MIRADFVTGLVLILGSLFVVVESWRMPRLEHLGAHPLSVPGIVPAFLAAILILCGMVLVVRSVRGGGHRLGLSGAKTRELLARPHNRRLLLTGLLTVGYAGFAMGSLPYWLATGLFVFAFVLLFEREPGMPAAAWVRLAAVAGLLAVATAATVTWVFERLFLVTLP